MDNELYAQSLSDTESTNADNGSLKDLNDQPEGNSVSEISSEIRNEGGAAATAAAEAAAKKKRKRNRWRQNKKRRSASMRNNSSGKADEDDTNISTNKISSNESVMTNGSMTDRAPCTYASFADLTSSQKDLTTLTEHALDEFPLEILPEEDQITSEEQLLPEDEKLFAPPAPSPEKDLADEIELESKVDQYQNLKGEGFQSPNLSGINVIFRIGAAVFENPPSSGLLPPGEILASETSVSNLNPRTGLISPSGSHLKLETTSSPTPSDNLQSQQNAMDKLGELWEQIQDQEAQAGREEYFAEEDNKSFEDKSENNSLGQPEDSPKEDQYLRHRTPSACASTVLIVPNPSKEACEEGAVGDSFQISPLHHFSLARIALAKRKDPELTQCARNTVENIIASAECQLAFECESQSLQKLLLDKFRRDERKQEEADFVNNNFENPTVDRQGSNRDQKVNYGDQEPPQQEETDGDSSEENQPSLVPETDSKESRLDPNGNYLIDEEQQALKPGGQRGHSGQEVGDEASNPPQERNWVIDPKVIEDAVSESETMEKIKKKKRKSKPKSVVDQFLHCFGKNKGKKGASKTEMRKYRANQLQ